jgi:predicted MFS family arabinose efflux permease
VVSGFSVALLLGVPLGTLVGLAWGWRAVFVALLALGLVVLVGILVFMPRVARERAQQTPRQLLGRPEVLGALGGTALAFMGVYITWTYVAPFLEEVTGLPAQAVAGVLLLLGLGSVVGNAIAGHTADRYGARPTVLVSGSVMALGLAGVSLFGQQPLATISAFAVFGTATGVFVPAQQTRLVALAPKGPDFALALNLAALNLGISVGAAIGSGIVDRGGLAVVGYASAVVAALAVGLTAGTTARS